MAVAGIEAGVPYQQFPDPLFLPALFKHGKGGHDLPLHLVIQPRVVGMVCPLLWAVFLCRPSAQRPDKLRAQAVGAVFAGKEIPCLHRPLQKLRRMAVTRDHLRKGKGKFIGDAILICRSPIPAWLMPPYVGGGFLVITEDDLRLGEKEAAAYMESQGLSITKEELAFVVQRSRGNAYIVRHAALKMLEGMRPGPEMAEEIVEAFAAYLESHVMVQWDCDLLEFLMQVSVTDEFTLPLAEMVTGNRHAPELLELDANFSSFRYQYSLSFSCIIRE